MTLPKFKSTSVIGRMAKPCVIRHRDEERKVMNIIPKDEIHDTVSTFAHNVLNPLMSGEDALVVPFMNGSLFFCCDILRGATQGNHVGLMAIPARLYHGQQAADVVEVDQHAYIPEKVKDRVVILVDDICDSGRTAAAVIQGLKKHGAARIITVFFAKKMHEKEPMIKPDYALFEIHSKSWVFGYGMDMDEKFRQLPFVCDRNTEYYRNNGKPIYPM